MPVKKYRTLTEAQRDHWLEPGDPQIWEGMCRRWALHRVLAPPPPRGPRGVFKYRSVEEKQQSRLDSNGVERE